jgi:hypothetical protein
VIDMTEEWFTYSELGERLNISAEAARQKAIRARWPRRTANDGKAQVKVDVSDVLATMPPRRLSDRPTPDQPPVEPLSDTRTIDALTAHIATLREMLSKADVMTGVERERADAERQRADSERAVADAERDRANALAAKIETILMERALAAEQGVQLAGQVEELRALVEQMKRRPWWRRFAH